MTIPSPEQFLAGPSDPEDDDTTEEQLSPLESIAGSLRYLVDRFDAEHAEEKLSNTLREQYDDLDSKYASLFELVEEIEGIVKPSTSKLANSVREAIGRWKAPKVETEPAAAEAIEAPADDADVEAWRAHARALGYTGQDVDTMNRSQIRTMLGIEQPVATDG